MPGLNWFMLVAVSSHWLYRDRRYLTVSLIVPMCWVGCGVDTAIWYGRHNCTSALSCHGGIEACESGPLFKFTPNSDTEPSADGRHLTKRDSLFSKRQPQERMVVIITCIIVSWQEHLAVQQKTEVPGFSQPWGIQNQNSHILEAFLSHKDED